MQTESVCSEAAACVGLKSVRALRVSARVTRCECQSTNEAQLRTRYTSTSCKLRAEAWGALDQVCIFGGVPKPPQRAAIRDGACVVVATPGRLLDLSDEGALELEGVSYLILDEAREIMPR